MNEKNLLSDLLYHLISEEKDLLYIMFEDFNKSLSSVRSEMVVRDILKLIEHS